MRRPSCCGSVFKIPKFTLLALKNSPHTQLRAVVILLGMALAACKQAPEPLQDALAIVDGIPITGADLQREADRLARQARMPMDKEALLDELVTRRAVLAHAAKSGLTEDPAVRRDLDNLIIAKVRERELEAALNEVEVSEEDVRAAYERDLESYADPAKVKLAILFRSISPGASEGKRAEVSEALEAARDEILRNPAPGGRGPASNGFGSLAVDESEDQASRYRGGDIGWIEVGRAGYPWPEPIIAAGSALPEGEVSPVLFTEAGAYLVMKTDARDGGARLLSEVAAGIRQQLLADKRRSVEDSFFQSARDAVSIDVFKAPLESFRLTPAPVSRPTGEDESLPSLPASNP